MTLRLINDDPRCRSQQRCALSKWLTKRGICNICAREAKLEQMHAAVERLNKKQVPAKFKALYQMLVRKVGQKEARRIINIEIKRSLRSPVVSQPNNEAVIVP